MKQRRILMLGGIQEQIIAIQTAKDMGLYVITCDNRPDNPGHRYADEYYNVSITDKEAVLELAKRLDVDAVVCYALEAGVQAAAYAQEKLGKPTSPYSSVHTLSNKKLFRQFLKDNGFDVPKIYAPGEKILYPVVVKPTDLWGSRGVSRVDRHEDLDNAINLALQNSRKGEILIEKYIGGHAIEGDAFSVNGKLMAYLWGDVYYDPKAANPVTPTIFTYPALLIEREKELIELTLQKLFDTLHMHTNAYNVELRILNDKVYLMEVAPRNGGNVIPVLTRYATSVDMIKGTILAALGEDCGITKDGECNGFWANCIAHTDNDGIYDGIWMDENFHKNNYIEFTPYVSIGDCVHSYSGTNHSFGNLLAKFNSRDDLNKLLDTPDNFYKVKLT